MFAWYADHARDLPWRRTTDPYAILVSEVMLQQTQVSRVAPRFERWMVRFPTLEALAAATLAEVLAEWSGLGYNNRAERLRRAAQAVVSATPSGLPAAPAGDAADPSGASEAPPDVTAAPPEGTAAAPGIVQAPRAGPARPPDAPRPRASLPVTLPELRSLPGVGPYTARAVLVFAHNADLAAVDANVRRVLTYELGLPHDLSPAALQTVADQVLPRGRARDWHSAVMDYGAAVLTGRATGIRAVSRQAPFEGSRRWYRSRALRLLLDGGTFDVHALAAALQLSPEAAAEIVTLLEKDGLVRRRGEGVRLA
ncbi:MAG: Fe-S cluster assembly protein HesB [Thermoleophilia bacterium]|nr:Fe-S cluster assembly protein HesB [Thermoleophilia bacterium]